MTKPVLIAGAGPVGLTAAVALRQQNIPCRIIDKAPHRTNQSRAAIIHARTMEVLERLGLADVFLAHGVKVRGALILGKNGTRLARFNLDDLPTAFNFFLGLTQSETERLLAEALSKLGVEIERRVELVGLSQTDSGVTAQLKHPDGRQESVDTPYLLGSDGGRSTTRHLIGLKMEGETLDAQWLTADVRIDWDHGGDEAVAYATEEGFAFIARMDRDRWRIVTNANSLKLERPEDATLELVQDVCGRRLGIQARIYDPVWISPFGVNTRMVPAMQVGRVFLAGDAAHVHSPIGGQGMNTGIQDAFNLAWKLALALHGKAGRALLDSFNAERHANAKRLLNFVGPATRVANLHHPVPVAIRNSVLRVFNQLGGGAIVARRMSELDVHYRDSPAVAEHASGLAGWIGSFVRDDAHPCLMDCWDFGRGPRPGERAPDAHGLTDGAGPFRLFSDWVGDGRHQLVVFTGLHPKPERVSLLQSLATKAEAAAPGLVRARLVRPADVTAAGAVVDADGEAHHVYGARYECLYLVRPDGYVGFRSQPAEWVPLNEFLKKTFAPGVVN